MAAQPLRLRPAREDETGVPDLQAMFFNTPFLAELYGYVHTMHESKNITTPCREGEHAHPGYDVDVLRDTVLAAFATAGPVSRGRTAMEALVVERRAWLVEQAIQVWARPVPAMPNYHANLGATFRNKVECRVSSAVRVMVRDINEGRPDRYLPTAAMLGHFFLHPPKRLDDGRDNYLERCLDYFRGTLERTQFDVPHGYRSKEDLFVDLLAMGSLFTAVSGWQRLGLDSGLALPLHSWESMTTDSQRLWARTLLALSFVRYTLDLDLPTRAAALPRRLPAALSMLYRPWTPYGEEAVADVPQSEGRYVRAPVEDADSREDSPILEAEESVFPDPNVIPTPLRQKRKRAHRKRPVTK